MRLNALTWVVVLMITVHCAAVAAQDPPPAPPPAPVAAQDPPPAPPPAPVDTQDPPPALPPAPDAEAVASGEFDAAQAAAVEAEAALGPLRAAMQAADTAFANASKDAQGKRQMATDTKNLSGEAGVKEQQQAEASVVDANTTLTNATTAKPPLDEALANAKTVAQPLQEAFDSAEKSAKEAEAAAKLALDTATRLDEEAKRATAQAATKRRLADTAKAALARAQQNEVQATAQTASAAQKLPEFEALKKVADDALANSTDPAALPNLKKQADVAAQKLTRANAQIKVAEAGLTNVKTQIVTATATAQAAEEAAVAAAAAADQANQVAAQAAAKRQAAVDAAAALAPLQQAEQQAQAQVAAAAQSLTEAELQKKAADEALVAIQNQMAPAVAAHQAAVEGAKEILQLDDANRLAAADAATKRQAAEAARAALAPAAQALEKSAVQANTAGQELVRAEARKKATEEGLVNLKNRIASAIQTNVADEQAANDAEAAAVPLKAEAERTRAAYMAAMEVADQKRTAAEQAKAKLYRLVAARQVAALMESPDPPQPANRIDEILLAKLSTLGIQPALCSDAVFIRRAFLDITGKLPSAEEAKAFIQDPDKNKRVALIDRLLDQPAHFDYWAMKWSDILRVKAEFPVKVWPNAAQAYHRFVWESIAQNKPYDQFVRELLTSSGSNFRVGPVNFYRAIQDKTPEGIATVAGLAFMGTRSHLWPEERRAGMTVFFSQVGYKPTSEWKEEIVFWDPLRSAAVPGCVAPGVDAVAKAVNVTNQIPCNLPAPLPPNGPLEGIFPDGTKITIPANRDPREVFAEWLIRAENPWFARAIVNRMWAWAMGRGIIHEPDDVRDDNPPSNPELLAFLEQDFVANGYDLKRLKRLIFTSTAYQFSSVPKNETPEGRANFASYLLRRVEGEVLNDSLNEITGSTDLYTSAVPEPFTYIPKDMNAVEVADGSITSSFLTLFGRSARATGMESERVNELASPQWLYLLNSAQMQNKLQSGPKLAALVSAGGTPREIAERLYLTILSRMPTEADVKAAEEYAQIGATAGPNVWFDLAWALFNSPEFLLRH